MKTEQGYVVIGCALIVLSLVGLFVAFMFVRVNTIDGVFMGTVAIGAFIFGLAMFAYSMLHSIAKQVKELKDKIGAGA